MRSFNGRSRFHPASACAKNHVSQTEFLETTTSSTWNTLNQSLLLIPHVVHKLVRPWPHQEQCPLFCRHEKNRGFEALRAKSHCARLEVGTMTCEQIGTTTCWSVIFQGALAPAEEMLGANSTTGPLQPEPWRTSSPHIVPSAKAAAVLSIGTAHHPCYASSP